MTTDPSGAWLELRELHSSLSYLKDKGMMLGKLVLYVMKMLKLFIDFRARAELNKTGQKLSAASCSGPIEFNFTSLPSSLASSSNCAPLSRVQTSGSSLVSPRRSRSDTHVTGKGNVLNGLPLSQGQLRERGRIPCQLSSVKNGPPLHRGEVDFIQSLRQPSTRSSFVPSGTAVTTTNNVTFTIDGIVTEQSLNTSGHSVKKAHYINDEADRVLKKSRRSGSKAARGSSKKLRKLVEKQKNAAEHRYGSAKSLQQQTDHIANCVDAHTSPDVTRGASPVLVDAATECRPHSATVATSTSATLGHESSNKSFEGNDTSIRSRVILDTVGSSSLPAHDYVEEYLDYLKNRRVKEAQGAQDAANVSQNGLQRLEFPYESDCPGLSWNEASVDPVWKRKFASVPQPKQYKGFSLTVDPPTQRKAHQPPSKVRKAEDAGKQPFVPIETAVEGAETTGQCLGACFKVGEKASGARPTKPAVITPTSWKEGRDLALKRHGPFVASVDTAAVAGYKRIISNAARVEVLRNLERSRSLKRKAQNTMAEHEGNSVAPATNARLQGSPEIHDFIMKQKLDRRQQKRSSDQCMAEAAEARQQRLERLYTFQRKTASESARIGREKMRRRQEDEQLIHGFVVSLKLTQNEFDQTDTQPQMFGTGSSSLRMASANDDLDGKCHQQLLKSQGIQVGGTSTCDATYSEVSQGELSLYQPLHSTSCTSDHLQYLSGDSFKPQQGFQYRSTKLVGHLTQLTSSLNEKMDEQFQMLGYDIPEQVPELGEYYASSLSERIQQQVSAFGISSLPQSKVYDCAFQNITSSEKYSDKAPDSLDNLDYAQVHHEAAKKIQHFFRHLIQDRKNVLEKGHHEHNKDGGMNILSCILEESSLPQTDPSSKPSDFGSKPSVPVEEPSYHLMPDPNTIARAWKNKSVKGDEICPNTSFTASPRAATSATTSREVSVPQALSESLPRENERASGGTSAEVFTSLLEEDTGAPSSYLTVSHRNATVQSSKSEAATEIMLPDKPAGMMMDSCLMTPSLSKPKKAAGKVGSQYLQQHRHSKSSDTSLVPVRDSKVAIGAFGPKVFGRSEPLQASLDSDRAWILLETQAKALQASAETARHLAQVRAPSLVEIHGEDMVQQLTASTVVAASALAAALASQRPDWQTPRDKRHQRKVQASSSSSSMSQPTDAGFESNDKTSPQSSAEESFSPLTGSGEQVQETQPVSHQDDGNASVDDSDRSGSSVGASISEELDTLGFSDSSLDRRKSSSGASKKRQPKNGPPLSLESSATEDSTGASNLQVESQGSLSETIILDRDLLSYGSLTERPLTTRPSGIELVEEERGDQGGPPLALLRLQERDLIERARADFTWIEVLKRNCQEKGTEDKLPALRKRQRGILLRLHQKRNELKALQKQCLAQSREGGSLASASNATSIPTHAATEVAEDSASGIHSSGISEPYESSLLGDQMSGHSKESSLPEEVPSKGEQKPSLPNSYDSTFESSGTFPEFEDSTHLKLNASKRFLEERQQKLQIRRKNVQQLLEWQKKLNAEEANVRALERRALAKLRARGSKTPQQGKLESSGTSLPSELEAPASKSKSSGEPRSTTYPEDASFEGVSEEVDAKTTPVTESVQEEVTRTESTSGGQNESTIESKVGASASFEAEVSTQTEGAMRRSSNSSRKSLLLIKKPLVVRRKVRRDSSGSEDSFNVSLSETASDQSDIEGRIIALSEELRKRQLEAEQLKREQRRRRTEMLREREESLKKHIELYDKLIQQAKEELEKELDVAQHEKAAFVKPQIKKPRAAEQRKHRLVHPTVHLGASESAPQSALVLQKKDQKPCPESPVAALSASPKKYESDFGTEEEHTNEGTSFASSSAEDLTPQSATPSASHKNTEKSSSRASASSTSSDIVEELSRKEVVEPSCTESTDVPKPGVPTLSDCPRSAEQSCLKVVDAKFNLEGSQLINTEAPDAVTSQDNTSDLAGIVSEPASDVTAGAAALAKSTTDRSPDATIENAASSGEDVSEHIIVAASEYDSLEESAKGKANTCEQPVEEPCIPTSDRSECQNDTTSDGILSSLGDIEASLGHEARELSNRSPDKGLPVDEVQVLAKVCSDRESGPTENLDEASVLKGASSPAGSRSTDSSGCSSSLEDESAAAEEVAEYTEEIVHRVVITAGRSCEEKTEERRVNEAVDSILRYLLEDTIRSLVSGKGSSVQHVEKVMTGQEATSTEPARILQNECAPPADVVSCNEHLTVPLKEAVTTAADSSTKNELLVEVCSNGTSPADVTQIERPEAAEFLNSSDRAWDAEQINAIADKLVSEAVDSVLAIAKEERLLTAVSVESDSQMSNVSQKVNAILASIEETRNNREFQRPQDLMVLSTDLDDEEFSWKDATAAPVLALTEDAPSEAGAKELCSRAVQAEDFLSTTTEQDWFDDDFGLGSDESALAYQRRIPNKPPPPYSPPKGGFMSRLFPEAPWKVPNTEAEVLALVRKAANTVYSAVRQGRNLSELAFDQEHVDETAPAKKTSVVDEDSHHAYCEFVFDLVRETAQELFCTEATDMPPPPWQRSVRLRRKQPLPSTLESFVQIVEHKVMSVPGLHENSELAFRNFDNRGLSFVDIFLHSEARSEEPEWVDYSREEVVVKDQVASAIFELLVDDTLEVLKSLWPLRWHTS